METTSHIQDSYEIIDQAVSLSVNMETKTVDSISHIRVKINSFNENTIFLNLVQPEIKSFRLHSAQLYHKEKNKANEKMIDKNIEYSCDFYTPSELITLCDKTLLDNTPRNLHHFEETSSKIHEFLDQGQIRITWAIKDPEKNLDKILHAYSKGWKLFFTLEFSTRVCNPIGPSFFQIINNKLYFLKDSSFGSARSLFPCQDSMSHVYYFSTFRVTFNDPSMIAICSGNLSEVQQSKSEKSFIYKINAKVSPNFLSIIIGEFYERPCSSFVSKIYSTDFEFDPVESEDFLLILSEYEQFIHISDKTNISMVLLPGIWKDDFNKNTSSPSAGPISQFFYYNTFIVNQELFLPLKFKEMNAYIISTFLKSKFLSRAVEILHFVSQSFLWILIGSITYFDDIVLFLINGQDSFSTMMNAKRNEYFKSVCQGEDRYCLSEPHFFSPNQAFQDIGYILKCNLTFICIGNFLKLNKENYRSFYSIYGKKRILTYEKFKKSIIKRFLLPRENELEERLNLLINFTGTLRLDIGFKLFKKDSKMEVEIQQSSLNKYYFADSNKNRFNIESYHSLLSIPHTIVLDVQKKMESLVAETEGIKKDEILQEKNWIVLSNSSRNSIKIIKCNFEINLIEIFKQDAKYDENIHRIFIESAESKHVLPLKSRFRRNYNKKPHQSRAENSSTAFLPDGQSELISRGALNEREKASISDEESENITFKIIPDPKKNFLFDMICRDTKANLLDHLKQAIERRESLASQLDLLQCLIRQPDKQLFTELCDFLSKKTVSCFLKTEILIILRKSAEIKSEFRIIDVLMDIIQTTKFEKDGTIKQSSFENVSQLFYFLEVIKSLVFFDKKFQASGFSDNFQKDTKIIKLILDLVKKNENSINSDDSDSYYQAFLLKILLKSAKSCHFDKICKEILRYLKTETYNNPRLKFSIVVIFRYFATFIFKNMSNFHYLVDPNISFKFSSFPIFSEHENLKPVIEHFQVLKKKLRTHPLVAPAIFSHKLFVKKQFSNFQPVDLLIYGLKYTNKDGQRFGGMIKYVLLQELVNFMLKHKSDYIVLQKKLILKNIQTLSDVIWSQISSGAALLDSRIAQLYLKIHEIIFNEYVPISYLEKDKSTMFPIDHDWMDFTQRINSDKFFLKEKKNVTFNFLSMQKKTKKGQIVSFPQNKQYDIRELIRQNFKTSKETPNSKNMMKNIINTILNEKHIMEIETNVLRNEQINYNPDIGGLHIKIKNVPHSMKKLKDKIDTIGSLEELKRELHLVVAYFKNCGYLSDEIYTEQKVFIDHLVTEGKRILREKREKEEASKQGLRFKLPGLKRTKIS